MEYDPDLWRTIYVYCTDISSNINVPSMFGEYHAFNADHYLYNTGVSSRSFELLCHELKPEYVEQAKLMYLEYLMRSV